MISHPNHKAWYRLEDTTEQYGSAPLTNVGGVFLPSVFGNGVDLGANNTNKYLYNSAQFGFYYNDPLTLSCFAKINTELSGADSYNNIVYFLFTTEKVYYYIAYFRVSGVNRVQMGRAKFNINDTAVEYPINLGTSDTYHFALTWNGVNQLTGYINGVQVGQVSCTNTLGTGTGDPSGLYIGKRSDMATYLSCAVDDIKLHNIVLPLCDIKRLMYGKKPLTVSILPDPYAANVVFLMQGGVDLKGHSIGLNGTATISTAQKKFSTSSLFTGGLGGWATIESSPEWAFPGDFTIEAWIYPNAWNNNSVIVLGNTSGGIQLGQYSTQNLGVCQNGIAWVIPGGTIQPPVGQWSYIAWSRTGSANRLYVNGNLAGTATDTKSYTQGILSLGCYTNGTYGFNGFIDGVRITKGVGRYPSSCPVPTAEFRL